MANLELAVVNASSSKAESRSHLYNRSSDHHAHNQQQVVAVGGARGGGRVEEIRRDEWSNEGINVLLDVYEAKWNHRNRGNLKGGDWDDVAMRVSARCGGGRMPKTPFQCKNKVASMKQKYRSEALLKGITGSTSSRWPFFTRLDAMLRIPNKEDEDEDDDEEEDEEEDDEEEAVAHLGLPQSAPLVESGDSQHEEALRREQKALGSKQERLGLGGLLHQSPYGFCRGDDANTLAPPQRSLDGRGGGGGGGAHESDSNASRSKAGRGAAVWGAPGISKDKLSSRDVAASICAFAHSILKLEEAKMVMYKDSDRLRSEMESRRVDMELKRTEIIMGTQLEIAKLLSASLSGNSKKRKVNKPLRRRATKEKPSSPPNLTSVSNPLRERPFSSPGKAHPAETSHPVSNATHSNSARNTQATNDAPPVHNPPVSLPQLSIASAQQSMNPPHVPLSLSASQSCSQHCRSIPAEKGLQGC